MISIQQIPVNMKLHILMFKAKQINMKSKRIRIIIRRASFQHSSRTISNNQWQNKHRLNRGKWVSKSLYNKFFTAKYKLKSNNSQGICPCSNNLRGKALLAGKIGLRCMLKVTNQNKYTYHKTNYFQIKK